jgi:hypothetical protein
MVPTAFQGRRGHKITIDVRCDATGKPGRHPQDQKYFERLAPSYVAQTRCWASPRVQGAPRQWFGVKFDCNCI